MIVGGTRAHGNHRFNSASKTRDEAVSFLVPIQIATKFNLGERALVFFDGMYGTGDPGPFPFAFTLGCVDVYLPST